ncbi:hypothetical protein Gorai_024727 [Gossypium raimondii]|uniref:CCHC-type domain-containing protein n=1 Tax=Gossypium raimondii TaxID=29730 RepID=A0A0D2P0W1_GOSRA|nr:hypothetical protein B456_003G132500 [Gossypium raimondii]MBA0582588.1 hypothetical protein [Gossypium raimondii]
MQTANPPAEGRFIKRLREEEPPDGGGEGSQPPGFSKPSFKDAVMRDSSENVVPLVDSTLCFQDGDVNRSIHEDIPSIQFSESLLLRANKAKGLTVIIKLLGRRVNVNSLQNRLFSLWKPKGSMKCVDIANDYFEVGFDNPADFSCVLSEGPWVVFGVNLIVQPWSLSFDPSNPFPPSIVSWIRIPNLQSSLYHKPILEEVGATVGKVVCIDKRTMNASRGRFARMAVLIDLTKPLTTRIRVNGKIKVVEYESLHIVCFKCGIYGHTKDNCPRLVVDPKKSDGAAASAGSSGTVLTPAKEDLAEKEAYEPWILVEPRKRPQPKQDNSYISGKIQGNRINGSRFNILAKNGDGSQIEEQGKNQGEEKGKKSEEKKERKS